MEDQRARLQEELQSSALEFAKGKSPSILTVIAGYPPLSDYCRVSLAYRPLTRNSSPGGCPLQSHTCDNGDDDGFRCVVVMDMVIAMT